MPETLVKVPRQDLLNFIRAIDLGSTYVKGGTNAVMASMDNLKEVFTEDEYVSGKASDTQPALEQLCEAILDELESDQHHMGREHGIMTRLKDVIR